MSGCRLAWCGRPAGVDGLCVEHRAVQEALRAEAGRIALSTGRTLVLTRAAARDVHGSWRDVAACRGRPTEWWYSDDPQVQAQAREVCLGCSVRAPCAAAGIGEPGMWGGLTAAERRQLAWCLDHKQDQREET